MMSCSREQYLYLYSTLFSFSLESKAKSNQVTEKEERKKKQDKDGGRIQYWLNVCSRQEVKEGESVRHQKLNYLLSFVPPVTPVPSQFQFSSWKNYTVSKFVRDLKESEWFCFLRYTLHLPPLLFRWFWYTWISLIKRDVGEEGYEGDERVFLHVSLPSNFSSWSVLLIARKRRVQCISCKPFFSCYTSLSLSSQWSNQI